MNHPILLETVLILALTAGVCACNQKGKADQQAEAPPPAKVEEEQDVSLIQVEHPEQFPLVSAGKHEAFSELRVTGTITPDISRNIPVISLAPGRIVEIHARLGDTVHKDDLLLKVQSGDVSQAFSDYRQAEADEELARADLERAKDLYEKGATAQKDLQSAEAEETKEKVAVETAAERIRVLGADPDRPGAILNINSPASGVVTEQNVTASAGVKTLDNSPNLFTISDLSEVWILCDVYENDLPLVLVGEYADVYLNAYPKVTLKGRIDNIGAVLDPNTRTAKVRLEVHNPGMLRFGMFVTAIFHGQTKEVHTTVPAAAILHLHDRDWIYVPVGSNSFRRVEVTAGDMVSKDLQEVASGIQVGQAVVADALVMQNTVEQ